MRFSSILAAAGLFASFGVATAALSSPVGVWLVEDQSGQVEVRHCGGSLCGYVYVPGHKLGTEILVSMTPAGANVWKGRIFDPKDQNSYDGKISLADERRLLVTGCSPGGGPCGTQTWTRVK